MRKVALLLLGTSFIASAASAKPWTVGQQTISYPPAGTAVTIMPPNTAPAYAYQIADIPSNFTESDWIHTTGTNGEFTTLAGGATELKARFDCNDMISAQDDPLLAYNVPNGSSHLHDALGNYQAFTSGHFYDLDYTKLRSSGNSTCYGGPLNRSLYWEPDVMKMLDSGVIVVKRMLNFISYYVGSASAAATGVGAGSSEDVNNVSVWPRGWSVIGGYNMTYPGNTQRAAQLATAGTGYSIIEPDPLFTPGFNGWVCRTPTSGSGAVATSPVAGSQHQPWLRNGDGTPTLDCSTNAEIIAEFVTPACWDGVNLDSPDERSHVSYPLYDGNMTGGEGRQVKCPQNWAVIPMFSGKAAFTHAGINDYTNWWFASDRMPGMYFGTVTASGSSGSTTLTTTAASASIVSSKWHAITGVAGIPALTMVTAVSGTAPNFTLTLNHALTGTITAQALNVLFNNGETGHFDFTPAWSYGTAANPGVFLRFMKNIGLTITQASTGGPTATLTGSPNEMGYGMIGPSEQVFVDGASPDGSAPNPIVNLSPNRAGKNAYFPLTTHAPVTGPVHNTHS